MRIQRSMVAGTIAALLLALLSACGGAPSTGTSATTSSAATAASEAASTAASEAASMAASVAASEAASTSAPSSGSTIPVYTGATALDASNPMGTVLNTLKQQLQQQQTAADVTVDAYTLPAGTTFDQVKKFYNDALTADGWTDAAGQANVPTMPGGGAGVWQKNGAEAVTVVVVADPTSNGGAFMMVAHAVPK